MRYSTVEPLGTLVVDASKVIDSPVCTVFGDMANDASGIVS
jgi:hypothetical protein